MDTPLQAADEAKETAPHDPVVVRLSDLIAEQRSLVKVPAGHETPVLGRLDDIAGILTGVIRIRGETNTPEARERAIAWFQTAVLPGFGGKTASDLVAAGKAKAVLDYLRELEDGGYA